MDKCGATVAWLLVFDNDLSESWEKKISWETQNYKGKTIHVVGC
jgi:hypothetical protein